MSGHLHVCSPARLCFPAPTGVTDALGTRLVPGTIPCHHAPVHHHQRDTHTTAGLARWGTNKPLPGRRGQGRGPSALPSSGFYIPISHPGLAGLEETPSRGAGTAPHQVTQQAPNMPRQLGGKNTPWPAVSAGLALPPTNHLSQALQAKTQLG